MTTVLRIYLARHGQTDWNLERRLQGWTDIPLNEAGRSQALVLAEKLREIPLLCVYCSGLIRSRQTAEIIAGSLPVVSLPELNEQSLGRFEGQYLDGRVPLLLEELEKRLRDPDDSLDGGESVRGHRTRVESGVRRIIAGHSTGGNILVVGHGGTNHQIQQILSDTPLGRRPFRQPQDHTELICFELNL